jgi:predicted Rossmann fold nucleotide-binding protein DprA/Smf involved in DNA uptake
MKHGETVFVRTGHSERPGNEALIARGALRAPDSLNELWSGDIASAATPPAAAPSLLQAEDAFSLVAPLLLQLLRDPLSAQQLAKAAGLTKSQAEIWMKRLLVEGRIERLKTKYHVIQAKQEQPNLFSSTS